MKTLTIPVAVLALAVALASCGGSSNNNSKPAATGGGAAKVLVDTSGLALYTPDSESAGKVLCTGACTSIWKPVPPGAVTGAAGKIGVITRPDGSKQATAAGKPLYTFAQDSPGAVTGNGASDAFGGRHFTWHVVKASGATATAAPTGGASNGY